MKTNYQPNLFSTCFHRWRKIKELRKLILKTILIRQTEIRQKRDYRSCFSLLPLRASVISCHIGSPYLNLHFLITCISEGPIGVCFIISHGKWLFYNVSRSSSHATALDLLPLDFSRLHFYIVFIWTEECCVSLALAKWGAVEQRGINNTCLSLKFTFIKRATAALHEPGEPWDAHTLWHFYTQLSTTQLRPLIFHSITGEDQLKVRRTCRFSKGLKKNGPAMHSV